MKESRYVIVIYARQVSFSMLSNRCEERFSHHRQQYEVKLPADNICLLSRVLKNLPIVGGELSCIV